jgi:hypothetical protein
MITNDNYFDELITAFPSLKLPILDWGAEMIHFRMETFAEYTIEQIKKDDKTEFVKCFNFQESKIDLMDSDLLNALTVSYCEALLLGKQHNRMKELIHLMPSKLRSVYLDYEKLYNEIWSKRS